MVKWSLQDSAAGGPGFNRSVFEQHTILPMELVNAQEAVDGRKSVELDVKPLHNKTNKLVCSHRKRLKVLSVKNGKPFYYLFKKTYLVNYSLHSIFQKLHFSNLTFLKDLR